MRRKHQWRYRGRLTRRASLARSLTAHSAAGLLLTLTTLPVITSAQGNPQSVTYRVTFEGKFTASALASGESVPSDAHFTTLIGAVHNGSVTFWSDGGTASAGIESMAEDGGTSALKAAINAAGSNALAVIEQSIASGGTATATVDITLTTDHPLVTLTSMVAPSPDWFVGVSGLSLRNTADDGWQPTLTVNLFPWDAGTEEGTEFSLSNAATSPQGTITSIKGMGKFSDEPIATLTFDLLSAPEITTASPILVSENETAVATLTADDSDTTAGELTWTIPSGTAGGADASSFTLSQAGVLAFTAAKDYETPDDADADRTYEVTVQVSDGTDSDMAELLVTLLNVTELTEIAGPESVTFPENSWSRVATFTASSEEDRAGIEWILGGTDSDHFSIDNPAGALRFALDEISPRIFSEPPDFEAPVDGDEANTYELTLFGRVGSSVTDTRTFTVTVTDEDEEGKLSLSSTLPALGAELTADLSDPDGVTDSTAVWQWERSTGRNSWAVIDGADAASYTPVAADTNTFLRVTATYDDEHGTGKTVSEVAPNVVTGPLLTGLTAETANSRANTARSLYPAFDAQTLHYGIGCYIADTMVLTVSAAANARVAVDGVQAAGAPEVVSVAVTADSDVAIRVTEASGAATTYVVHCLRNEFFQVETVTHPGTDLLEDLILFNRAGHFTLIDRNGVPRLRRAFSNLQESFAVRFHRIGASGAYRYPFLEIGTGYQVLDEDFKVVADGVRTVDPLTRVNSHDFQILEDGNYLIMSHEPAARDFSDIDLPPAADVGVDLSSVDVEDSAFQIVTPGRQAVFTWNSWGNMAIEDCVQHRFPVTLSTDPEMRSPRGGYAHINGMHVVDGVLAASMRGCSKVLGIDVNPGATRGDVLWRMGRTNLSDAEWAARDIGPRPLDFINDPEGEFCSQHTARFLPNGNIFLFDNGVVCAIDPWTFEELGREGNDFSRAVEYALDLDNHEAVFVRDHSLRGTRDHVGYATGNVDALDNGDWMVSWGRVLDENDRFPDNEMATLVDPATGQEKLGIRFRELPSNARHRFINATVAPAEALAPQPVPLTAEFPDSTYTSIFHTGAADAPRVVVAFSRPVVDFDETSLSLSVTGATIASVSPHRVAGEAANAYVVTLTPAGAGDITFGLVADQTCAGDGICTADGAEVSEVPASQVIRADTTPPEVSRNEVSSNPGTDRTYAAGDRIRVTVTFSETVEVTGMPQLRLEVGGGQRTATYEGGSGTAALVFGYTVAGGESGTDGVGVEADSLSLNGGMIRDVAGNDAVLDHDGLSADSNHKVDGVKPALAATGGAVVDGTTLTLTYDESLDRSSTPDARDFTVSGGDQTRMVTRVSMSASTVTLTLSVGVEHEEAGIQVSYTPGMNPLRDVAGNQAEGLSREPVTNQTPDTTPPEVESLEITSNPGSDQTYAAADEIEVTVAFSETVKVTGTPQLTLRVGNRNRTAGYESGTDTASLAFAYEVADGDEDTDGVSVGANQLRLNGGTIKDEAENAAELAHEALAADMGHQVDGVRPAFVSAAVDGASLTLTYRETLDGGSRPASGDFAVTVGGNDRTVSDVSVSASVVTLTLNPEVEDGDAGIRVSYTPGATPIRDEVGNDAQQLSNRSVTNTTNAPNTDPEITSSSSFDVPENQIVARRLAARDTDPGDEVTGWAVVGGADQGQFSITSDTGELSFQSAPDYEDPLDVTSTDPMSEAGDNEYVVTVEVTSGAGARDLEAEQTFIVRVTDEREPPEVPGEPAISGETADSLTVSWSEPDNTGPDITDYDVQYREKDRGRFVDGGHEGPGLSLTLTDLEPGTAYEVQVRARNDEGTSDWSASGEGMTIAPLTVVMASETGPPVSGSFMVRISFSEPVSGFSGSDIESDQDPECTDDLNNPVFCDPGIGGLQTADDRVFTTTVTPETGGVAHSYTLRLTVPAGRVNSSVGSKPNEEPEEPLEVRVSPPGVPEPISTLSLAGSGSNESVRLSWNRPSDNGGSPIIRYEYRYAAIGEAWSEWENVGAGSGGVTVGGLINGREYVIEARAVNALGKGGVETVMATPIAGGGGRGVGGGGGGGGGGGLLFPPEAPAVLTATPGDGTVRLEWSPPESDGGSPIQRFEYRLKDGREAFGEWVRIEDSAPGEVNATGYTVSNLGNGTVYVFELRAVNQIGNGRVSEAVEVVMPLDPAYRSNFRAEDLEGGEAGLEWTPFGGSRRSLKVRFGGGLRFEERELDAAGEVTATRMGSYRYRYTSRTTGELSLDYDGGETCELRMSFGGVGAGSYSYRCGGALQGQGSFRLSELNRLPEITSPGQFEVVENQTKVVRLEAVDSDEGDEVAGYGIAGGADAALFTVVEETGELSFTEAPDYERPADAAGTDPASGAGDNEYVVVVEARSGEGERERKGQRAVRVRVSDEEEPPEAPPAPAVRAEGTDSLTVSWSEPENRGPEITGYEVRYREEGEEGYRDGGHEGTGLRLTLTGLEEERLYRVEVRAVNEEGRGEWSQPGEGRTEAEEPDPDDPSHFTGEDLEGRRLRLRLTGGEDPAGSLELRFGEDNRFEQMESGGEQTATRTEGASRTGAYTYERTGPRKGRLGLDYDDGSSCEVSLTFTELGEGGFVYDCGEGEVAEGSFRLTTGSPFVPVILSSAGRNNSFFTSELTLTNRGMEEATLHYIYTADAGGGSGTATDRLDAGRQKIETDALDYLRGLGVPIPATGNRIGTLRVEVAVKSEVEAVVRTTTLVPEGRAGLAYLGVAEEEGFDEPVYLCGLRQNSQDRSNVAFQNMGTSEEGAITLKTTVYSGEASDTSPRELDDVTLEPGGFHQYSGLLGSVENGYVKVERVEGEAPFYAYGVINDQANSDGSFVFPVTASSLTGTTRQTLPVIVETGEFRSELTVTNFSQQPRRLEFEFAGEQVKTDDKTVAFSMELEGGEQEIVPEVVEELRRQGVAGLGTSRGFYLGPLFVVAEEGDLSGIVIGARTGSKGGGGQYSVFYNAVPQGEGFTEEAWVEGLQQNEENRSNLALVNTGEVDGSASIFHLEIYNGETGMLAETVVTKPIPARGWHQIDGILLRANPETRQGYIRIEKVSGENPFLAYGVVNDGRAPGERSGDGAYLPARE